MPQRQLAADLGLSRPRLRRDGIVVVHSDEAGYLATTRLSATDSELIAPMYKSSPTMRPVRQTLGRCGRRRSLGGLVATLEHLRSFTPMTRAFLNMTGLPDTTRSTSTSGLDCTLARRQGSR